MNMSNLGHQKAKSMKLDSESFDIEEYMVSLAKFIGGGLRSVGGQTNQSSMEEDELEGGNLERWDWDKLGRTAARYSRRVPTIDFLWVERDSGIWSRTRKRGKIEEQDGRAGHPLFVSKLWSLLILSTSTSLFSRLGPLEVEHKQRKVGLRKKFDRPVPEAQAQRVSDSILPFFATHEFNSPSCYSLNLQSFLYSK